MSRPSAVARTPVAVALLCAALFTMSWDRLAVVQLGTFNVKPPVVLACLTLLALAADSAARRGHPVQWFPPLFGAALVLIVVIASVAVFARDASAAGLQVVTLLLGAFIPGLATYVTVQKHDCLDAALTAIIRGGWLAAGYGTYQLVAFYVGLPQGLSYTATSGGLGRIAGFNYEAGYFGYFIVLVLGALFARAYLRGTTPSTAQIGVLVLVLVLGNSRATLLTLPVLLLLILSRRPGERFRRRIAVLGAVMAWAALVFALLRPDVSGSFLSRAATIIDPSEPTSNSVRLRVLETSLAVIEDHPFGIGAGNFRLYASEYGGLATRTLGGNEFIANNIWIQALLDGGWLLLVAQVVFVGWAARALYRRSFPVARALMAGWLTVLLVGGLVTSYFWDVKLWIVLALALTAISIHRTPVGAHHRVHPSVSGAAFQRDTTEMSPERRAPGATARS